MPSSLFLILTAVVLTFAYAAWRAAPWVPTWRRDIDRFVRLADIKPGQRVYDLGCGDGRLVRAAARAGAIATGFEISLLPYCIARIVKNFFHLTPNHTILFKDFWNVDLSSADLIYVFLTPRAYPRLKEKLERELRSGTRVITYVWPIEGWTQNDIDHQEGQPKMYLYER
jgi:SAM-dependent methyltransferase